MRFDDEDLNDRGLVWMLIKMVEDWCGYGYERLRIVVVEDGEKGLGLLRIQGKASWDQCEWLRMSVLWEIVERGLETLIRVQGIEGFTAVEDVG